MTTAVHANSASTPLAAFRDLPLVPHANSGVGPVHSLSVSGSLHRSGALALEFTLAADLRSIRLVPVACNPQRRDELWHHTCFELFARRVTDPRYCEFNFSPSGDWAAYAFDDYRSARSDAAQDRIDVTVRTSGIDQLNLRARIDLRAAFSTSAALLDFAPWRLNCAAVIEGIDGSLSYWATHHPRPQPDFHDAAGFRITLNAARAIADTQAAPP